MQQSQSAAYYAEALAQAMAELEAMKTENALLKESQPVDVSGLVQDQVNLYDGHMERLQFAVRAFQQFMAGFDEHNHLIVGEQENLTLKRLKEPTYLKYESSSSSKYHAFLSHFNGIAASIMNLQKEMQDIARRNHQQRYAFAYQDAMKQQAKDSATYVKDVAIAKKGGNPKNKPLVPKQGLMPPAPGQPKYKVDPLRAKMYLKHKEKTGTQEDTDEPSDNIELGYEEKDFEKTWEASKKKQQTAAMMQESAKQMQQATAIVESIQKGSQPKHKPKSKSKTVEDELSEQFATM